MPAKLPRPLLFLLLILSLVAGGAAILLLPGGGSAAPSAKSLEPFASEAALRSWLKRLKAPERLATVDVTASDAVAESPGQAEPAVGITNVQEAGVDEGGIVKAHGDFLIILRRGRLFTVSLARGGMRAADSIDAYPPGVDGTGDWYDEMLVSGDRIAVVGYSYSRGGTVVNRFRLGADGKLTFDDAYDLKSNDYYSSRNYASRLIGSKLVFYTPLDLSWKKDPLEALPGLRRWGKERAFRRIAEPGHVYQPPAAAAINDRYEAALHTVTSCDLAAEVLDCSAIAVLGPWSRSFYVSPNAVYLWITTDEGEEAGRRPRTAFVYRLPLDGGAPAAIATRGAPIDQFSFREDAASGVLDVLVQAGSGGDAMWMPEFRKGDVALLRLPLSSFGNGDEEAARDLYRRLPAVASDSFSFQNRFAGPWLLYGAGGATERTPREGTLIVTPVAGGEPKKLSLPHGIDRIDLLGRDAIVVGASTDGLGFSTIELNGANAALGDRYFLRGAAEGENRSHAFYFRASNPEGSSGLLGLPVVPAGGAEPWERFLGSAASVQFLRRDARRLAPAGSLEGRSPSNIEDDCRASCVDWYGNARPIFLGDRVFALLGYELVEGRFSGERIREVGRVGFAPPPRRKPQG
jgi:hypothetical protein